MANLLKCFSASGPRNPTLWRSAFSADRPPLPPSPSVYLPRALPLCYPFYYPPYLPALSLFPIPTSSPLLFQLTLTILLPPIPSSYLFLLFFLSFHRYSLLYQDPPFFLTPFSFFSFSPSSLSSYQAPPLFIPHITIMYTTTQ